MGLKEDIVKGYIQGIDWVESSDGILSFRFPMNHREIPCGVQLTVRSSQLALFLDDGAIADIFEPGRYTLNSKTLPLLSALRGWDPHFASPFKSDVFFFSTKEQIDQKWGTPTPLIVRDPEIGPIRLRAHGTFSYGIQNPRLFFEKISGTVDLYRADQAESHLRSLIIDSLRKVMDDRTPFVDLTSHQEALAGRIRAASQEAFAGYGLVIRQLKILGLSLPKELETYFDRAAGMRMVGDVGKYLVFRAADSLGSGKDSPLDVNSLLQLAALQKTKEMKATAPSAEAENEGDGDTVVAFRALRVLKKRGLLSSDEAQAKAVKLLKK